LKAIERAKDESYVKRDKDALNRIYADDYLAINALGGTSSKSDVLKFTDSIVYESHVSSDITVREFSDFAIVTGTYSFKYKKPAVGDDSGQYRYTSVYVRRADQWQIAAEQFTRIKK